MPDTRTKRPDPAAGHYMPVALDRYAAPGTPVVVTMDNGIERRTITRSEPWCLPGGHWVVLLEGLSGGYALERVRRERP